MKKYIFVIEDHPLYRDALQIQLGMMFPEDDITAIATAEECVRLDMPAPAVRLLIVDFHLRGLSGSSAICTLRQRYPEVPILVLSASEDRQMAAAALRAGAVAFLSKALGMAQMKEIILRAANGEITQGEWHLPHDGGTTATAAVIPAMPNRQREILAMVCHGLSNKEIAIRLAIAEVTVKMHLTQAFRALGVVSRSQAICTIHHLGIDLAVAKAA